MGPRLLCFLAGATLSTFFLHLGLLATPFFGSGAFVWANVFGCYLLSLAVGVLIGHALAVFVGFRNADHSAGRLAFLGGLGAFAATYALPWVCRETLSHDPNWLFAPAVAITCAGLLPGALLAATVPAVLRARAGQDDDGPQTAHDALRLLSLSALGGVVGAAASGRSLYGAEEIDVWLHAYALSAVLPLACLLALPRVARALATAALIAAVVVVVRHPSEIQTERYAVALDTAWERGHGAGSYYLRTTHPDLLTPEQLAAFTKEIKDETAAKPGPILACELLYELGEVTVSGEGLVRSLELLIPPANHDAILPLFKAFESVRSDGKGMLHVTIRRHRGQDGVHIFLPGETPDERTELWIQDDFTIHLIREPNRWKLEFGPLTVERAGVFEFNDTAHTPLRLPNITLWIDASLLGLIFEDHPERLVVKAIGQGEIGDVSEIVLASSPKTR